MADDIFSAFGGAALKEPAPAAPAPADPFAAFGGQAVQPDEDEAQGQNVLQGIAAVESRGQKDPYKAKAPTSSAVGKYQYVWSVWGDQIRQFAGKSDLTPNEFMANPDLQEKWALYNYKTTLKPQARKLQKDYEAVLTQRGIQDLDDLAALVHFQGYGRAAQYLRTGQQVKAPGEVNVSIQDYLTKFREAKAPKMMAAKAPVVEQAPAPAVQEKGLLEPFALRKDYNELKNELTKLVPLEERKKLDQPIIYGGHIENVREKRVMPSEFEALARKHGVKAEDLKPWAAFFGTPAAEKTVLETLKQAPQFIAGELGEIVTGGIPQKLLIEAQDNPKMVAALDDLRTIAENKKGWAQRGAEIVGGFATGTGIAKGAAKLAGVAGAGKIGQAAAAATAGITEAGVFGAAQAERGKEVAGFTTGVLFGTAVTGAISAGKQVIKGASKLNEMRTNASKALQSADPQFMERAATRAAEETGGVGSIFNTAVVSNSSITYEDMKDARALADKLGQDNVDALYEYAVKTRPAKAEVIAENVRVRADELKQKIADVEFRLQSEKIQPETRAKLEDSLKSLQITLQKTDVDPKLAVVRSTVENLTRGLASDILGTRIAYKQSDPLAALRVYSKKGGEGLTSDLDRFFLKQTARKMVRAENYKSMPEAAPTLKRLSDVLSASRFTAEGIDRKYGTKLQPALDSFGRLYSDLHSYVLPRAKETSDLIKQTRSANLTEGDDLFNALSTGQSTGDQAKDVVVQSWRKLFDDVREDASNLGLNIAYRKNYVPMKMKPQDELFASLNQAVDTLKERGIADLRNVKPDKDTLAKLKADDLGSQLLASLDKLATGKGDYQTKLISVLNDTKTGAINRVIAARGLQRGDDVLPALIQDKDVGRLAQHWIESTFRSAVMREPIAELRDAADLMKRIGDKNANKYLQNLVADLTGIPRDGGLGRELSQIKSRMAATLQDKAVKATNPTEKAIYSTLNSFTDSLPLIQNTMYGNALGGPRQVIANFSSIFTMTMPELGYLQGGKMIPKALLKSLNTVTVGENIIIRNPQVAKRLGVNIGDTVKSRSFRDILENEGLASSQRFENLERSISNTLRKSTGREMTESGINSLAKLQLFLFEGAEKSLRMMTRQLGKDLAEEYAKQTPDVMRFADALPRSYRKMLDAAATPQDRERILTDYMLAKTVFNYNQASASEVARNLGPILSSFTKWPTEILGDSINTFEKNGVTAGSIDLIYRRFLPLIALIGLDQLTGWRDAPDDSPVRYLIGKQGAQAWAPTNSLASIFGGEVAPPIVTVPAGIAKGVLTADPDATLKTTKDALRLFTPAGRWIDGLIKEYSDETK